MLALLTKPAAGRRDEAVRDTDGPNRLTSVSDSVRSPVSRLTDPGPAGSLAAPAPCRSTVTATGAVPTAVASAAGTGPTQPVVAPPHDFGGVRWHNVSSKRIVLYGQRRDGALCHY